jgi:hypothetical protein
MLGVALPALPATQDLSAVMQDLKDLVEGALGVDAVVKMVETSKAVLVRSEAHEEAQLRRSLRVSEGGSVHAQNTRLREEANVLRAHIAQLETYIKHIGL